MTERSATLEGDLKCCSSEMCLSPRRCWVEHSEIKTVRTGVTCVTLPGAAKCKTLLSAELVCAFTPFFFFSFLFKNSVTTPLCSSPIQVKVTVSRLCFRVPPCALCDCPLPLPPPPSVPRLICTAVGSGCCDSGCGSSCCQRGRGWRSWRRKAGGSDCPWWGSRAGEAETWDPAVTMAVGRCGSGSGLWRAGGGCAEPDAQPTGCGAPTPSLLSTDTTRGEVIEQLSRLNEISVRATLYVLSYYIRNELDNCQLVIQEKINWQLF